MSLAHITEHPLSNNALNFVEDARFQALLNQGQPDAERIREIVAKSMDKKPLEIEETAALLAADDPELIEEIYAAARQLKQDVYGNRIVLFAPLYIGNYCINNCRYCGFKVSNTDQVRRTLSKEELIDQVEALEQKGHKRLILVYGEHPDYTPEFIAETVRTVYGVKAGPGSIRRVNINAPPLTIEGFRTVKEAGIGTYQIFQETYHEPTYRAMHPVNTAKGDFMWRLDSLSRAMEGGCDDVGIGALFGLYNWKYEVLGLVAHSLFLQERFGVGPHTISFPRLQQALGRDVDEKYLVKDEAFKRLIAILRLSVPYTGLILTARERPQLRREVMEFGVSQIDAGTRIEIGGYTEVGDAQKIEREQFQIGDIRSLDEVMGELIESNYIPSFCTACYRLGRTGEHFMEFAIPGFIQRYCTPNALTTLKEYLVDYASPETRKAGEELIENELAKIEDGERKRRLMARLTTIETSLDRDLYE